MKNWSRYIEWQPQKIVYPSSEVEIQKTVVEALEQGKKIRIIGTGHSFTPLSKTDDTLVNLNNYQGLTHIDKAQHQATAKAGTTLRTLGELLFEQGMGMENLGDIDVQTIAGTISTGTHGTGKEFGTISTQVIALKFVNGKGEIVSCSNTDNRELFKAAQVSLGTFGIITEVTLQCVPAYKLKMENGNEALSDVLSTLDERMENNRNFEFYWFPYTEKAWTKTANIANDQPDKISFVNHFSDYVLENYGFKILSEIANKFPSKRQRVSRFTAATITNISKVYHSHKVYATQRLVRFHEMEYNVPTEAYPDVFKDIKKAVNSEKFNIHFPIENRAVKGDDIYMSPAYQRDSMYIACHAYYKKNPLPYFKALEEIFRAYNGRPHWGKMNTLTPTDIADMYPMFETFLQHRAAQDPDNIFVSPYFKQLFGIGEVGN